MTRYLISLIQPVGEIPPPDVLDTVMADLDVVNKEIQAAGEWVFTGGLHQPDASTVVRLDAGEVLTTDGPYAESREFVGGLWIVDSPDLDAALGWAARITGATTLPTEVRPFQFARD